VILSPLKIWLSRSRLYPLAGRENLGEFLAGFDISFPVLIHVLFLVLGHLTVIKDGVHGLGGGVRQDLFGEIWSAIARLSNFYGFGALLSEGVAISWPLRRAASR